MKHLFYIIYHWTSCPTVAEIPRDNVYYLEMLLCSKSQLFQNLHN